MAERVRVKPGLAPGILSPTCYFTIPPRNPPSSTLTHSYLTFEFEVLPNLHFLCLRQRLPPPHQRFCQRAKVEQLLKADAQVGKEGGEGGAVRYALDAVKVLLHSGKHARHTVYHIACFKFDQNGV